ncbi:unnamed protein product, partial [Symbiodinium microadriaticum]
MLLSLNAVTRACVPYAIAASVRTEMDHAQEDLEGEEEEEEEEALLRTSRCRTQRRKEMACRPKLGPKWAKPASKGGKGPSQGGWHQRGWGVGPSMLETLKTTVEETMADEETPALHERGMDCGGRKRLKPNLGVPLLGSRSEEANRCGGPATVARGSTTIGGPADDARPQKRCHEELQDLTTRMTAQDQYKAEVLPFMVSIGPRGESSAICFNALRILSGSAIMKLIGVRVRPERGQEPQLIKQLKQSYMGTTFCEWSRKSTPWSNVKLRNRTNLCYCNVVFQCLYWLGEANSCKDSLLLPSDLGIPLLLHLPGETLQTLVDSWHNQFATHALTYHGGDLFLQICDVVAMPVFTEVGSACTRLEQFRVVAAVFHL